MIGFLKGKIKWSEDSSLIIDIAGVGYLLTGSGSVVKKSYRPGDGIELYVYTHVREDQITLFGFSSIDEKRMFELLLGVSGIGPKSALSVVSSGSPDEIRNAVATAKVEYFSDISGIGKKSAQRIIVDLKSKLGDIEELDLTPEDKKVHHELIVALKSMGFKTDEIKVAIKKVNPSLGLEDKIRQSLKELS